MSAPSFVIAVNPTGSRRNIKLKSPSLWGKTAEDQCWKCTREYPDQNLTEIHCCLSLARKSDAKWFASQDTLQCLQSVLIIHFIIGFVSAGALDLGMSKSLFVPSQTSTTT